MRTEYISLKLLVFRAFLGSILGVLTVIVLVVWSQKSLDNYTKSQGEITLPSYLETVSNPHVVNFFIKFSSYYENCPEKIWYTDEVKAKILSLAAMNHPDHPGSLLEKTVCTPNKICYSFGYPLSILVSSTKKIKSLGLLKNHLETTYQARVISLEKNDSHIYLRFVLPKASLVFQGGIKDQDYRGPWGFDGVFRDYETDFVSHKILQIEKSISELFKGQELQLTLSQDLIHSVRLDKIWWELGQSKK
jgi:hypothetical protein